MSGAPLLIIAAAALREAEEKKEKERLEQLIQRSREEKTTFLATKAVNWKKDEDIVSAFDDVLQDNYSFNSMQTGEVRNISIQDFFAFLTQFKEKKEIVRIIQENELFKRTFEKSPYSIRSFISATCWRSSAFAQGNNAYRVERDIFQNRQKLFQSYCPEQRTPSCLLDFPLGKALSHFSFELLLDCLQEKAHPALKEALAQDVVVPATIMASNDKEMEKKYRRFLEKKSFYYKADKKTIDETFQKAKKLSMTPEYQDLFTSACPAIKTKWKYGIFPTRVIDTSQNYECPIMKKVLNKQNTR